MDKRNIGQKYGKKMKKKNIDLKLKDQKFKG